MAKSKRVIIVEIVYKPDPAISNKLVKLYDDLLSIPTSQNIDRINIDLVSTGTQAENK